MAHRFSCFRPARLNQVFCGLVSVFVVATAAQPVSSGASELLRSPGWLAVMPDDSQPVVPQVRAKGREWFVDAAKGDDMGAGSKASPWKTLGRIKRAGLSSGDVVRLRCGSVWRETLLIDGRNWPSGLTLASDGVCALGAAPSIRGSDVLESAWQADPLQAGVSSVDRFGAMQGLVFKGKRMIPARMPDFGGIGKEYAQADGQNSARSFRLREKERRQVGDRDLVGAMAHVRVVPWQVERALVKAYDASTGVVTLDKDLSSMILTGAGYILEGKRWMLDAPGEWFHDNQAKRLYLMTPDRQRPASGDVELIVREHAVMVRSAKQLRMVGLDLRQTAQVALDVQASTELTLEGLEFSDPGEYAVVVDQSSGLVFRGSRVRAGGWSSVMTRQTSDVLIEDNVILDSGLAGRASGSSAAIIANGERNVVSRNLIWRAANAGINFANKEGNRVVDNVVLQPCLRMTDCGGIYTWTGHSPSLATRKRVSRALVKDNVVLGGASNLDGTGGRGRNQTVGIYLDEMSGGVTVQGNVVAGTENGIFLHNAQFNDVVGNTVRSVSHASVMGSMTLPDGDVLRGNRMRGNFLLARPPSRGDDEVFAFKWLKREDPSSLFRGADANEVQDNVVLKAGSEGQARWVVGDGTAMRVLSSDEWRKLAQTEKERVLNLPPEPARKFNARSVSLVPDGDFRDRPTAWIPYFNPAGSGGSATPGLCDNRPCMRLTTGHPSDALSSKPFRMDAQPGRATHVLRYTAKAGPRGGTVRVTVRRNGPPYDGFGLAQPPVRLQPGQVLQAELPFDAVSNDPARIDFSAEPGAEVQLSQVSLTRSDEASSSQITMGRSVLLINLASSARSVSCADTKLTECAAIDDQGRDVKWPVSLLPRQSLAVFPKQVGN